MFRPSMNESYRRNDSLANAKWGSLSGPSTIRQSLQHSNNSNRSEEPKIRPRWIQEIQEQANLDAATSLLRSTTIGNKKSKSRKQQNSLLVPKSPTSSLLDSLAKQRRRERWLEMLPTRPQSMGSILRSKASASRKLPAEDPRWNERIREVKEFVREHGHGRIPINYPPNQELARWSKRQRFHYRLFLKNQRTKLLCPNSEFCQDCCHMTQEHLQDLNEAGFCFDLQVARWDRNYQLLKRSKSVPTQHKNAELRKWIEMQRFQMSLLKRGGKSFLNPERIQKLNDIGFAWQSTSTKTISNLNLAEEQDYKARTKHCGDIDAELFQMDGHNSGSRLCHDSVPTEIVVVQTPTNECIL